MPVTGQFNITYADYDGEKANAGVTVLALSSANYDEQATLRTAFVAAVEAMVLGELQKTEYGNRSLQSLDKAADPAAQRELKWLVQYHDDTTLRRYSMELPCADTDQLDPEDRANAEIGDAGIVDAFITAFNAYVLSPVGNEVVVDEITLVGRNV